MCVMDVCERSCMGWVGWGGGGDRQRECVWWVCVRERSSMKGGGTDKECLVDMCEREVLDEGGGTDKECGVGMCERDPA